MMSLSSGMSSFLSDCLLHYNRDIGTLCAPSEGNEQGQWDTGTAGLGREKDFLMITQGRHCHGRFGEGKLISETYHSSFDAATGDSGTRGQRVLRVKKIFS